VKSGLASEEPSRSRGGPTTKSFVRANRQGKLLVLLTAGERHDHTMFEPRMERDAMRRAGHGRAYHLLRWLDSDEATAGDASDAACAGSTSSTRSCISGTTVSVSCSISPLPRAQSGRALYQPTQEGRQSRHCLCEVGRILSRDAHPGGQRLASSGNEAALKLVCHASHQPPDRPLRPPQRISARDTRSHHTVVV
jgi:hypothetical protein